MHLYIATETALSHHIDMQKDQIVNFLLAARNFFWKCFFFFDIPTYGLKDAGTVLLLSK